MHASTASGIHDIMVHRLASTPRMRGLCYIYPVCAIPLLIPELMRGLLNLAE